MTRWLIVCDCAGLPAELVGVVDVDGGAARVWHTGRGGAPTMRGVHRRIREAPPAERAALVASLRDPAARPPVTVTFTHPPCGKTLRVGEDGLAELLGVVSKAVGDSRVSLPLLCAVNGRLQRGGTR